MSNGCARLEGLRIFVVEDEFAVLLLVEDMLAELGCELAGAASRLSDAIEALECLEPGAAILDVNLRNETVYPVAELLAARNVPIVFSTGYGKSGVDAVWHDRPILQKPYRTQELGAALERAVADAGR